MVDFGPGQTWSNLAHFGQRFGRIRPSFGQARAKLGRFRASFSRTRATCGRLRAKHYRFRANFGRSQAEFGGNWPNSTQNWSTSGPNRPLPGEIGRVWSNLPKSGHMALIQTISAGFGLASAMEAAKSGRCRPMWGRIQQTSTRIDQIWRGIDESWPKIHRACCDQTWPGRNQPIVARSRPDVVYISECMHFRNRSAMFLLRWATE